MQNEIKFLYKKLEDAKRTIEFGDEVVDWGLIETLFHDLFLTEYFDNE